MKSVRTLENIEQLQQAIDQISLQSAMYCVQSLNSYGRNLQRILHINLHNFSYNVQERVRT